MVEKNAMRTRNEVRTDADIRWGDGTRYNNTTAIPRLIEAAIYCYTRLGIRKTSIADIAAQAKITRPTVYRYFSSRESLIDAVVRTELLRLWGEVLAIRSESQSFFDCLEYAITSVVKTARANNSGHQFLFHPDVRPHLFYIAASDPEFLSALTERFEDAYALPTSRASLREGVDLLMAAELVSRLTISHAFAPSATSKSAAAFQRFIRNVLSGLVKEMDESNFLKTA